MGRRRRRSSLVPGAATSIAAYHPTVYHNHHGYHYRWAEGPALQHDKLGRIGTLVSCGYC